MGKWKAIRENIRDGKLETKLFDLEKDPREQINLAERFPDIIEKIEKIMVDEHEDPSIERFMLPALSEKN